MTFVEQNFIAGTVRYANWHIVVAECSASGSANVYLGEHICIFNIEMLVRLKGPRDF